MRPIRGSLISLTPEEHLFVPDGAASIMCGRLNVCGCIQDRRLRRKAELVCITHGAALRGLQDGG